MCARDSQKAIFLEESLEKVTFCHLEETGNLILVDTSRYKLIQVDSELTLRRHLAGRGWWHWH